MSGLVLHLSGPMQSWGTHSHWNIRETLPHPSRSGLIGLLGAALGHDRRLPLDCFSSLEFTIRVDRRGQSIADFHTVGGGRPREQTPPTAGGGRRAEGKTTIISERYYLSDAAFTVAVSSSDEDLITALETALHAPVFGVHLGRRSCPPTGPLLIARGSDPATALVETVPLAREKPRDTSSVVVEFITEHPPEGAAPARRYTHPAQPLRFATPRSYEPHTTWHTTRELPVRLCAGLGTSYLDALLNYRQSPPPPKDAERPERDHPAASGIAASKTTTKPHDPFAALGGA
ncbi:type I-E CRISPR-associated protein Cas5/CasD [Nocardia farcinica]|uniref:type I-E CRISPR-associated protein Cas5/CasD n=1 Tax=Nocardia farcinica TaxID=37329 RepID=UPI0024590495|nr:type I-E CRISPR-associated protein Cas5/CasD [Nocardia farcinica]